MSLNKRSTLRKSILQRFVQDGGLPILLEELRWKVFKEEMALRGLPADRLTESYQKSFNRTIRDHEYIHSFRLKDPERLPLGIVTRAAVYRIQEQDVLKHLLASPTFDTIVNVERQYLDLDDDRPYNYNYIRCIFIDGDGIQMYLIRIQSGFNITILDITKPTPDTILTLARRAPWRIRRRDDSPILSPTDPVIASLKHCIINII